MAGGPEQRARPDFSNPADVAFEMSQLHGAFAVLQSQTSGSIQNLTGSVQALQSEVRNMANKVEEVTRLQVHQEQHSDGLTRAFAAIENLANLMREGFKSSSDQHEARHVDHVKENNAWRVDHLKENQATHNTVMRWSGAAAVLSFLAAAMVGVIMWYSDKADAVAAQERAQQYEQIKDAATRVRNIEYYLSQGGAAPDRRYVPK